MTTYICTTCYRTYPSGGDAKAHLKAAHPAPAKKAGWPAQRGRKGGRKGGRKAKRGGRRKGRR